MLAVSFLVAPELWAPVADVRCWDVRQGTTVNMPEAAMYEYDLSLGKHDKVWLPGKVGAMKTVSITLGVDKTPYEHFRPSVL
jgi:hypothetical protein